MQIIYVKPTFKQLTNDEVLFACASFVELRTGNLEHHQEYILNLDDEYIYNEKLNQCLANRKAEYDKLNQFELRYDDLINGTTIWEDTIASIKQKYPKPLKDN